MAKKDWDNHIEALADLWDKEDISCPPHRSYMSNVIMKEPTIHVTQRTGFQSPDPTVPRARVGSECHKSHKMEANEGHNEAKSLESQCLCGCVEDCLSPDTHFDPVGGVGGEGGSFPSTG